jgi:CheY-like chemotaxis protein
MSDQTSPLPAATETSPVILLVEDEPNDALLAKRALEKSGVLCRVMHVIDGEQAIKYLGGQPPYDDRGQYPAPILVLLDLKMPKVTGFDVLSWLHTRPELVSLPVVVLTGSIHERDRADAQKLGAVGYEIKPVDFSALLGIVQGIGTRWLNSSGERSS